MLCITSPNDNSRSVDCFSSPFVTKGLGHGDPLSFFRLLKHNLHRQLFKSHKLSHFVCVLNLLTISTLTDQLPVCLGAYLFHYRQIPLTRHGGHVNKINESINTTSVNFFLWSQHANYFGSVNFYCLSTWWRQFGQLLSFQLPRSCCWQMAASVDRDTEGRSEIIITGWCWIHHLYWRMSCCKLFCILFFCCKFVWIVAWIVLMRNICR